MSVTQALSNALSGLTANARMAEVVSANVANSLTEGYVRRTVELQALILGEGAGVRVAGIHRDLDASLLADRRSAGSSQSRDGTVAQALSRLETMVGDAGSDISIASRITAFEQSLVSAATDPSSDIRLGQVVDRLDELVMAVRDGEAGIRGLRQDADTAIADQVEQLNSALVQVQNLNDEISNAMANGQDYAALADQRQMLVDEISTIVPVREIGREAGRIALYSTGGQILLERRAVQFGFVASPVITADMTLASGGLSGITIDGAPLAPAGAGRLSGGSLSAAFTLRDETLVAAQRGLDLVAEDLVNRFQDPATDPTLVPGDAGMLTDSGTAFDPVNLTGLSGRLRINAGVDPAQGGTLSRLRDGMNAVTAGPVGSATQIESWLAALDRGQPLSTGGVQQSAADHAAAFMSGVGADRLQAERELSFATARWSALREQELAQGVDSDQEMQWLLKIEQAYAANAKVIQAVDEMMQRVLEM